jgi:hypothetical protein
VHGSVLPEITARTRLNRAGTRCRGRAPGGRDGRPWS